MVSRETLISEGLHILGLPAASAARLEQFAGLLELVAIPRGYMGPAELERLVSRHLLDAAALATHLEDRPLIDVGSGAGLPGIVLAIVGGGPVFLLEAETKRATFLEEASAELGLDVRVIRDRAEEAGRGPLRDSCASGTARALAAPVVALEYTMPFVKPGGRLVFPVGPSAAAPEEQERITTAGALLGGRLDAFIEISVPGEDLARWAMIITKVDVTPERYPRRTGVPARRPLA